MPKTTTPGYRFKYIWNASKRRLAPLIIALAGLFALQNIIPDFAKKLTFTVSSIYAVIISFTVAVVGLIVFSMLLNTLIAKLKVKIDFHPDDYNVASGVTEAITTPGLTLPFAVSWLIVNPLSEELFFRMLIIGYLSTLIDPIYATLISVITYYLFTRRTKEIMEFVIIAIIGMICAYLYLAYSLWYSVAANAGFVLGIYATIAAYNYLDSKR